MNFKFIFIMIKLMLTLSFKIQHIKTPCWTISCYETHYNNIFIEINKNPGYLHHNTIQLYSVLFTTIVYK